MRRTHDWLSTLEYITPAIVPEQPQHETTESITTSEPETKSVPSPLPQGTAPDNVVTVTESTIIAEPSPVNETISDMSELYIACKTGDERRVQELIASGVDVNQLNEQNRTALHRAVMTGNKNIVKILLDAGASVNLTDGMLGLLQVLFINTFARSWTDRVIYSSYWRTCRVMCHAVRWRCISYYCGQ